MRRKNIIISCLALTFSICLMVFGVYAAINPKVSVSGQVTYQVRDAKVMVQGKVNGALDSNGVAINGEYVDPEVDASDYTSIEPITDQQAKYLDYTVGTGTNIADDDLTEWEIGDLSFSESSAGVADITISFKLTNFSLYPVKATLSYDTGSLNNVNRIETKTECTLNPTGQVGDTDEIVVSLSIIDESEDVPNAKIDMNLTFQKGSAGGEGQLQPTLKGWNGQYDNTLEGIVLTNYHGDETDIVIPSALKISDLSPESEQLSSANTFALSSYSSTQIYPIVSIKGTENESIFDNAEAINSVTFSDQLLIIGDYSLYGCSSIKEITIPKNIKTLGYHAFGGCTNLTTINFEATHLDPCADLDNGIIQAPFYQAGINGEGITVNIGKDVTKISSGLFALMPENESDILDIPNIQKVIFEEGSICQSIDLGGFAFLKNLVEINLPNSLKNIDTYAFYQCYSLNQITIPENVTNLGYFAFGECKQITSIVYKATKMKDTADLSTNVVNSPFYQAGLETNGIEVVISKNVEYIPAGLFVYMGSNDSETMSGVPKITSLVFEEQSCCKAIGLGAFAYAMYLTQVNLPNTIEYIDSNAFAACVSLLNINIPESVKKINADAFLYCTNLTEIHFDAIEMRNCIDGVFADVVKIFSQCGSNSNGIDFYVGNKVKKIPAGLCYNVTEDGPNIKSIIFEPESVCETIGSGAFIANVNVTEVYLPDSVKNIELYAFGFMYGLQTLSLPSAPEYIDENAFTYCNALNYLEYENAYYLGNIKENNNIKPIVLNSIIDKTVTSLNIAPTCKYIATEAFASCELLTEINIPEGVLGIGDNAFKNCYALQKISIPDSINYLGESLFTNCNNLIYNEYKQAKYLGNENNEHLILYKALSEDFEEYEISSYCKYIQAYAFSMCDNADTFIIPDSVVRIGRSAFCNTACETIIIGSGVEYIGEGAFGSSKLKYIVVPDNVKTIESDAFEYNNDLVSIVLPKDLQIIPSYAFVNCPFESITIPNTVKEIGKKSFYRCQSLKSIVLPETLEILWESVFDDCTSLTSITFLSKVPPKISSTSPFDDETDFVIYVPASEDDSIINLYKKQWSLYADKIQEIA